MSQAIKLSKREMFKSNFSQAKDVLQGNKKLKQDIGYASMTKEQKNEIKDYKLSKKEAVAIGMGIGATTGLIIGAFCGSPLKGTGIGTLVGAAGGLAAVIHGNNKMISHNRFSMYIALTKIKKDQQQANDYVERDDARHYGNPSDVLNK